MSLGDGGDASLCEELFEFCIPIYCSWFLDELSGIAERRVQGEWL